MPVVRAGVGAVASSIPPQFQMHLENPDGTSIMIGDNTSGLTSPRDIHAEQLNQDEAPMFLTLQSNLSNPVISYVTDWQIDVAETYIVDACKGRPPHVRMQHHDNFLCFKSWTPLRVYDIIHHRYWRWLMSFLVSVQLILGFFEHAKDARLICTIIELFILALSSLDAIFRLFCHDSHPTKNLHSIHTSENGLLLDRNGDPVGGVVPFQNVSLPTILSTQPASASTRNLTPGLGPKTTPLPSFQPIPLTNTNANIFSSSKQQQHSSNSFIPPTKTSHSTSEPLSFTKFSDNYTSIAATMAANPDLLKQLAQNQNTTAVLQRPLPAIEPPASRFSKHTNQYLAAFARFISWSRVRLFFIFITTIDIAVTWAFGLQAVRFYRITRLIRPFFLIEKGRVLRQLVKAVGRTIPAVLEVVVLIFFTISTFSIAGFFLFSSKGLRIGDNPFFSNLENSMFSMTVLMTTANFPDVMMASYSYSTPSALFFCTFLIIALYLLFNVILSAVYSRFQYEAYRLLHTIPLTQLYSLTAAFELLSRPTSTPLLPSIFHQSISPRHNSNNNNNNNEINNKNTYQNPSPFVNNNHNEHADFQLQPPIPTKNTNNNTNNNNNNNDNDIATSGERAPDSMANFEEVNPFLKHSPPNGSYGAINHGIALHSLGKPHFVPHQSHPHQSNFENIDTLDEPLLSRLDIPNSSFIHDHDYDQTHQSNISPQFKTHARGSIESTSTHPLSFSQTKKRSWLYLLNLGYTQHARVGLFQQYKTYLEYHYPTQSQSLLQSAHGPISCSCQDVISQDTFLRLLERMRPDLNQQQRILLFEALDQQHHHHIHIHEWFAFADFVDVQFIDADYRTKKQQLAINSANIPQSYPAPLRFIGHVVTHPFFNGFLDVLSIIHFAILLTQLEMNEAEGFWTKLMDKCNAILLIFYLIEYLFKIIIFGPKRIYKSLLCSFELLFILLSVGLYIYYYFANRDHLFSSDSNFVLFRWLHDFWHDQRLQSVALSSTDVIAFRAARLYRHIYRFPRFRAILVTLKRLYPALRSLGVILISEYYFFGILGVCLFSGLIKKGEMSPEFMATYWAKNNYWENNFNDLYHAYILLFEIMIINNWNLNIEAWAVVTDSHWPRVFFVCHFFLAIVIILNCVIALVLDAFISKYSSNEDDKREQRLHENTVRQHQRDERDRSTLPSGAQSHDSNTQNNTSLLSSSSHGLLNRSHASSTDADYVMIEDDETQRPYEIDDNSSSDDEAQQLVLTLIKRADHQHTIQDDTDEEEDLLSSTTSRRSLHHSRASSHRSRMSMHRSTAAAQQGNNEIDPSHQQRIVFKRRTQRMYQMIFDSRKS